MHNKAKHRDVFFVAPVAPQKNTRVLAALGFHIDAEPYIQD